MEKTTQQQINQYEWQVADGVARAIIPERIGIYPAEMGVKIWNEWADKNEYHTNAPDGIYSGEAFEEPYWQYNNNTDDNPIWNFASNPYLYRDFEAYSLGYPYHTRLFLRLKPSHLPAVLTTQPGEEWKDRYREVWYVQQRGDTHWTKVTRRAIYDNYTFERYAALQFDKQDQATKREWHLITPPAEQEAETAPNSHSLMQKAQAYFDKNAEMFSKQAFYIAGYMQCEQDTQSTLTQKYQRIAELEMDAEHVKRCLSDYTKMCQKKLEEAHVNPLTNFIYKECIDLMRNLKNSINRKNGLNI